MGHDPALTSLFNIHTDTQNAAHSPSASRISCGFGENISTNCFPFTSAEKLDTKNGIMNSRMICHGWSLLPAAVELIKSAVPMMPASPSEVSQMRGLPSG